LKALETVTVETGPDPSFTLIWMHGLGADGHDFEPIVPHLGLEGRGVRFVFPHAPRRAVTINMGLLMPAWYDIRGLGPGSETDEIGIADSAAQVEALVAREQERGVPSARIVLAGFSQGGVIALHVGLRHAQRLAGIMALSTYLPEVSGRAGTLSPVNAGLSIFQAHGTDDPMIPIEGGERARDHLTALGYPVEFHAYPMEHTVAPEEIADLGDWLRDRLPPLAR